MCVLAGVASAGMIVQHSGATNPTTEGFTLYGDSGQGSALTPDSGYGINAWATLDNTSSVCYYQHSPTSQEQQDAADLGYTVTAKMRIVEANKPLDETALLYIRLNSGRFVMKFETDAQAIPTLYLYNGSGDWAQYTLSSAGYHTYSIKFDGATDTADLLVDGAAVLTGLSPNIDVGEEKVFFGNSEGKSTGYQTNWASYEFSIVPEPVTMSLLVVGGLAMLRRKQ